MVTVICLLKHMICQAIRAFVLLGCQTIFNSWNLSSFKRGHVCLHVLAQLGSNETRSRLILGFLILALTAILRNNAIKTSTRLYRKTTREKESRTFVVNNGELWIRKLLSTSTKQREVPWPEWEGAPDKNKDPPPFPLHTKGHCFQTATSCNRITFCSCNNLV